MRLFGKALTIASAGLLAAAAATAPVQADWPENPIRMVVQFNPGGGGDQSLLPLKPLMEKSLGKSLLYTYKPGAGSRIGTEYIFAEGKEGYAMGGLFLPHFVNSIIFSKPKYSVDSFMPLGLISSDVPIFFVQKDSPFKDMKDLVAAAKKGAGTVSLAIGSFTGEHYIVVAVLEKALGISFNAVNVKGGSKVMSNVIGKHFDVGISRPASILRVRDEIRGLGIAAAERNPNYPEAPTLAEQFPGVDIPMLSSDTGVMVPKAFKDGNPAGFAKLAKAFEDAIKSPDYAKVLERRGLALGWKGPDAAAAHVKATFDAMQKYKGLIEAAKSR